MLAIAAARLGWEPVTAVELDAAAVDLIRANAARNRVELQAREGDVRAGAPSAPTVLANLPRAVLLDAARTIAPTRRRGPADAVVRPPQRVIVAGMLEGEADEVVGVFEPLGLRVRRRIEDDGWAALVLA